MHITYVYSTVGFKIFYFNDFNNFYLFMTSSTTANGLFVSYLPTTDDIKLKVYALRKIKEDRMNNFVTERPPMQTHQINDHVFSSINFVYKLKGRVVFMLLKVFFFSCYTIHHQIMEKLFFRRCFYGWKNENIVKATHILSIKIYF